MRSLIKSNIRVSLCIKNSNILLSALCLSPYRGVGYDCVMITCQFPSDEDKHTF